MQHPSLSALEKMRARGDLCWSFAENLHPKPRFYKYYWWVFCKYSEVEGDAFLSPQHWLSTAKAMKLMERLDDEKEPRMVYNTHVPRHGSPFDPDSTKWKSTEWAPAFDDDEDEIWKGHK